jgi:hypothetical protein
MADVSWTTAGTAGGHAGFVGGDAALSGTRVILPNAILRKLSDEEMAEYRRPFSMPGEGRRPTLTWPRQIPIEGEPADVSAIAADYAAWLGRAMCPSCS